MKCSEKNKAWKRVYYAKNKERFKQYYKDNKEKYKERSKTYGKLYRSTHVEYCKKRLKDYTRKQKQLILNHYGMSCACCGEDKIEFLTIDHIKGGGTKHRKELNIEGSKFYRWLIKENYPLGYRTLCINCNFSLGNYGYCPHHNLLNKEKS